MADTELSAASETETTEALSIELVDAELDAFEVPSVFLDVPPIQVAMNDAVARDFGFGPIEAIEEEIEEEKKISALEGLFSQLTDKKKPKKKKREK